MIQPSSNTRVIEVIIVVMLKSLIMPCRRLPGLHSLSQKTVSGRVGPARRTGFETLARTWHLDKPPGQPQLLITGCMLLSPRWQLEW